MTGIVENLGGYVANFIGDGVIAYFGWPSAQEDQAAQAVRAGRAAVELVAEIALPGVARSLTARVGIATGLVVVGDLQDDCGAQLGMVTGSTPNSASRVQGAAPPGGVAIEATTRALLGAAFDLESSGLQEFKGFDRRLEAWRVGAERTGDSRFDSRGNALTRFTGRTHEVGLLLDRWGQAKSGDGQVVLISGDPGIGKSRIVQALRERIEGDVYRRLRYQCSPHHVNTALHPVIQQLEHAAGLVVEQSAQEKLDKLECLLRQGSPESATETALFAALLSIPFEERYGCLEMAPSEQRIATMRALQDQLLALAAKTPILFVLEDAHWIDPTTEELIVDVVPRLRHRRVLMLITHRPEWSDPFQGQAHVAALQLTRLARKQVAEMVRELAGQHLPDDALARIAERTDGIPLFVEEMTKSLIEAGFSALDSDVPVTLQASLTARLDRLGAAREVAQIGAVIGREFSHDLIVAIAASDHSELEAELDRLCAVAAGIPVAPRLAGDLHLQARADPGSSL